MILDPLVEEILSFWIGPLGETPPPAEARMRWFTRDPELDEEIRRRFGGAVERALAGELDAWGRGGGRARVALVVLLDQFTRNLFRGDARSFAGDEAALALSRGASAEEESKLHPVERYFLLIPWEHSEVLADQEEGVERFRRACDDVPPAFAPFFAEALDYAERHRVVIERFGRFPHRNAVLGRTSTAEEEAFLAEHPEGF